MKDGSSRRSIWAMVPARSFRDGKTRLSKVLDPTQRAGLQRAMLGDVLGALSQAPLIDGVAVVSPDREVWSVAERHGAHVISDPGRGINGAAEAGARRVFALGAATIVVLPADIPFADPVDICRAVHIACKAGAPLVVPDRHRDGTNLLVVHKDSEFRFRYGPGSFRRHSRPGGMRRPIVADLASLRTDIDTPRDLATLQAHDIALGPATRVFVSAQSHFETELEFSR